MSTLCLNSNNLDILPPLRTSFNEMVEQFRVDFGGMPFLLPDHYQLLAGTGEAQTLFNNLKQWSLRRHSFARIHSKEQVNELRNLLVNLINREGDRIPSDEIYELPPSNV